jgi:hypothetical protein
VWIVNGGRRLAYEPADDFYGTETFTYHIGGQEATVTVVVEPVNDAPRTVDDIYWTRFDEPLTVDVDRGVLANDHDVEGDELLAQVVAEPMFGTVVVQPDGSFEYQPAADFRGRDSFTYVAADGSELLSLETTVRIDVGTPIAQLRLEVANADGQIVQSVSTNQLLWLRAWVKDLRDAHYPDRGIAAGYLDVLFDDELLQPLVDPDLPHGFEIQFGEVFDSLANGDVEQPGLIDEVGATATSSGHPGAEEVLLFEAPFEVVKALAADDVFDVNVSSTLNQFDVLQNDVNLVWDTELIAEQADQAPQHDVLLFDSPGGVGPDQVVWENTSLELTNGSELRVSAVGETTAGGEVIVSPDGASITYAAPPEFVGVDSFTYTVIDQDGRTGQATVLVNVLPTWQNLRNRYDVNSDGYISPIDALLIIYDLNQNGSRVLDEPPAGPPFIDVDGDGAVAPRDALLVISVLNGNTPADDDGGEDEGGEGEGGLLATDIVASDKLGSSSRSQSDLPPPPVLILGQEYGSQSDSSSSLVPGSTGEVIVGEQIVSGWLRQASASVEPSTVESPSERILGQPSPPAERIADILMRLPRPLAEEVDWLLSRWDDDRLLWQLESALADL